MPGRATLLLLLAIGASGCAHAKAERAVLAPGKTFTADDIARSGATTAWEVLRRSGSHISLSDGTVPVGRRGRSSIVLSNPPLVYIDGARLVEFNNLRQLPADHIDSMRILSGIEATPLYGTNAGNGVIEIRTRTGATE
jgi:outer membrane cobalamin receptor